MKTRVSKIARLPYQTREQLNLRLLNGQLGAPLLKWLNELPNTKEILLELFDGKPITKQNLSEWRHGGYHDWLIHQRRQENFQQMNEQGSELEQDEGVEDSFENFARLLLADLAATLNQTHEIANADKRWQRLHEISRDLARLQHGFNHSRRVELAFSKWRHETGCDEDSGTATPGSAGVPPASPSASCENKTHAAQPTNSVVVSVKPDAPPAAVQPSPTQSAKKNPAPTEPSIRIIYHRQCGFGCICKDCHPNDGDYPYAQAIKDYENHKDSEYRHQQHAIIFNADCDCYCGCPKSVAWEQRKPGDFPYAADPYRSPTHTPSLLQQDQK